LRQSPAADLELSFALTLPDRTPGAATSRAALTPVLDRSTTLAGAKRGAIPLAARTACGASTQMLAVLDRDARLVLAGDTRDGLMPSGSQKRAAILMGAKFHDS